ncbi:MAG TPA: acyltransferase [Allosphingosinicella sp.]|jgi:exopolysaccharide production protein ExoZ|nr:acyltransferase [Allosphingosinicella sp.]
MLTNLQAMRAFAAIAVMLFHFALMPATSLPFKIGAFGVDLFFVLSGFIIAHSAARSSRHFLAHRLIRVLPPYWIATLIAVLPTLPALGLAAAGGWLVQSLFYLPGPGGRPALIFVGWTLVYELGFYLLYWLALRLGTRLAPFACLALLAILAFVPLPRGLGPWPLLLEFAMGICIYLAVERTDTLRAIPGAAGLALAATGLAMLLILPRLTGYTPDDYQSPWRVVTWGLPAAAVVLGLVVAEKGGLAIRNRFVLLLGGASYAIYLLHPIAVGQLFQLAPRPAPLSWLFCLGAATVTIAVSIAFYLWIEAPLLRLLRGLLRDRPPVVQAETPAVAPGA